MRFLAWLGAVFVRGWVCGGCDFFIFSFILVAQAWCLRFYSFILRLFNLSLVLLKLWHLFEVAI